MRRSGRERVPNKKYTVDAFAGLELENILRASSSSASEAAEDAPPLPLEGSEEDDEFNLAAAEAVEPVEEEDDHSLADDNSEGSSIATPHEGDTGLDHDGSDLDTHVPAQRDRRIMKYREKKPGPTTHFRGVRDLDRKEGKPQKIASLVGSDPKDAVPFLLARDRWIYGNILPTRKAGVGEVGSMGHAPVHTAEEREEEANEGWDWYYEEGGCEAFREGQATKTLNATDAQPYLFNVANRSSYKILLGPYGLQKPYDIAHHQSLDIEKIERPATNGAKSPSEKAVWLLNVSTPVTRLEWAPNHGGKTQYLAISTADKKPLDSSLPSAFAPSGPSPSTIQIWEFSAVLDEDGDGKLSTTVPPRLVHVICTDWGRLKHFKWCQVPRRFREADSQGSHPIGLLAAVFDDGLVRVLDVHVRDLGPDSSPYVQYTTAAFATRPPNTVCSCVTWLSATEVAVGCASGFVAIFDITEHLLPLSDSDDDVADDAPSAQPSSWPTPFFYHSLHASYVLAISSTYPTSSNFIATTSIDGHTRLTDIRAPYEDFVLAHRARVGQFSLDYHIATQAFMTCDDQDFTRMHSIRAFYSTAFMARSDGQVTCIAAAKCHASIIVGSADGGVLVTNPMPKTFNSKEKQRQVLWFKHEWAAGKGNQTDLLSEQVDTEEVEATDAVGVAAEDPAGSRAINDHQGTPSPGMSRFTTSYLPTSYTYCGNLANNPMRPNGPGQVGATRGKKNQPPHTRAGYTTVFEEQAGVTAVAWNPNVHVGGWAAAGLGSGLVRVEDLAADR